VRAALLRRAHFLLALMRNLLLINKLGIRDLGAGREINLLAGCVPVVQVSDAGAEVGSKSL
jgi:hypothetical protein